MGKVPFRRYEVVPMHRTQAHILEDALKLRVVHPVAKVPVSDRELFKAVREQLAQGQRE